MSDQSDNERQPQVGSDGLVRLLPCPFCGHGGAFCDHDETGVMAGLRAHVECGNKKCRAFGPDGYGKAEAEAKWNALRDPYEREAAKAAIHTLQRDLERERLKYALRLQDAETIRRIIEKGGTTQDVMNFLDTPDA